jgi:hypothetical protein
MNICLMKISFACVAFKHVSPREYCWLREQTYPLNTPYALHLSTAEAKVCFLTPSSCYWLTAGFWYDRNSRGHVPWLCCLPTEEVLRDSETHDQVLASVGGARKALLRTISSIYFIPTVPARAACFLCIRKNINWSSGDIIPDVSVDFGSFRPNVKQIPHFLPNPYWAIIRAKVVVCSTKSCLPRFRCLINCFKRCLTCWLPKFFARHKCHSVTHWWRSPYDGKKETQNMHSMNRVPRRYCHEPHASFLLVPSVLSETHYFTPWRPSIHLNDTILWRQHSPNCEQAALAQRIDITM